MSLNIVWSHAVADHYEKVKFSTVHAERTTSRSAQHVGERPARGSGSRGCEVRDSEASFGRHHPRLGIVMCRDRFGPGPGPTRWIFDLRFDSADVLDCRSLLLSEEFSGGPSLQSGFRRMLRLRHHMHTLWLERLSRRRVPKCPGCFNLSIHLPSNVRRPRCCARLVALERHAIRYRAQGRGHWSSMVSEPATVTLPLFQAGDKHLLSTIVASVGQDLADSEDGVGIWKGSASRCIGGRHANDLGDATQDAEHIERPNWSRTHGLCWN